MSRGRPTGRARPVTLRAMRREQERREREALRGRELAGGRVYYRRDGSDTVYVRDGLGRYSAFAVDPLRNVRLLPGGRLVLPHAYGRVDFADSVRFSGRTRGTETLLAAFRSTPPAQIKQWFVAWSSLPRSASHRRRTTNQGMNDAMLLLTGDRSSATEYAGWYAARHPAARIPGHERWEWCHLYAHSIGGADGPDNIVAARSGNNSEQLAIESALAMYRHERIFSVRVRAAVIDDDDGRHLGNVICYEVRCDLDGSVWTTFLDCLGAPTISAIHFYDVMSSFARWANRRLVHHGGAVSAADARAIRDYIATHALDEDDDEDDD